MDVLYRLGSGTVSDVRERLPSPPTDSAVRAALRLLVRKGAVEHRRDGPRNVYRPSLPREEAGAGALRHTLDTFFRGSRSRVLAALLDLDDAAALSDEELTRLERIVEEARRRRGTEGTP